MKEQPGTGPEEATTPLAGEEEREQKGPVVVFGGKPRVVRKAKLQFQNVKGEDVLKVVAEGGSTEGDGAFKYEWTINGEPTGEGDSVSGFKRGDKISVKITPFDEKELGPSKTLTTTVTNTPPKIIEHREQHFEGQVWSFQIKASDRDGDALTYALKGAPAGMAVDPATGLIRWNVPGKFEGKAPVTVSVSDGHGGQAEYGFEVIIASERKK
ncbi:MAG: Ig domain-containing protein [Nitrospirae bacterium]|nr:Ig domain-containing protein [Nitrospirota bacterium]